MKGTPRHLEAGGGFHDKSSESAPTFNSERGQALGRLPTSRKRKETIVVIDKMKEKQSLRRQCREGFKEIDQFGQSLNLTWNGQD